MAELNIEGSKWPLVQVGRIVMLNDQHEDAGKLAAIVEIIDHKRVLVEGPSSEASQVVLRKPVQLSKCLLSKLVIANLPRGSRHATVKKFWEKEEIDAKRKESHWYKRRTQVQARKNLTDFERFKVMRLQKQRTFEVRKAFAKIKAAA
jgi:large subunit ribosomal protein L14e